eukprot:CAMPEP_0170476264 /NCGR_PEP_ID=MMETSP0123-20130129/17720_1 /TAXON_ID=182087 /ORGANISM="Favella ehrenbergii, Strain Fehren 1" /LENGTH=125 /DNA_ID=CAMNT_0010747211 /DNA_START=169 /DNA_END=546 /DNA_ORIENTATION=-
MTYPGDCLPEGQSRQLMKDVYALGVDEDSLLLQKEELEYHFQFEIDHYVILAQIMLKLDLNLKKTRHEVVPEIITEDEFGRSNWVYRTAWAPPSPASKESSNFFKGRKNSKTKSTKKPFKKALQL